MNTSRTQILDYASRYGIVNATGLISTYGIKPTTARQYLSSLSRDDVLVRVGRGEYTVSSKQMFVYSPSEKIKCIYAELKSALPFTDFCVYGGDIMHSIQHHLSINNAIYVETNREAVDSVFSILKEKYKDAFKLPNATLVADYIDLREQCIIVKTLITESPLMMAENIKVPTLEKLLVDIQTDADFDYLLGSESQYMFQMAFELYNVNVRRMLRYAKRRGISMKVKELINSAK